MQSIDALVDAVIRREGGFENDPLDRGGATKYGITQKTLAAYLKRNVTVQQVKDLTVNVAKDIYEKRYFFGPGLNKLPEDIQAFIFDSAVNHGPTRAIKFVQHVCLDAGFGSRIDVDGICGPLTQQAAAWAQQKMGPVFLQALQEERRNFYKTIVAAHPEQSHFLAGWLHRVDSFQEVA